MGKFNHAYYIMHDVSPYVCVWLYTTIICTCVVHNRQLQELQAATNEVQKLKAELEQLKKASFYLHDTSGR